MIGQLVAFGLLQSAAASPAPRLPPTYPFGVGESFQYSGRLGFVRVGRGTIAIAGLDTVRGVPSFVFRFQLEGGLPIYRLNSVLESRTGVQDFKSRQFIQESDENGRSRSRKYDIYPDSGFFLAAGDTTHWPTPRHPLDDAAFLYYVRTLPLAVGKRYELDYYFKKERNPLSIWVEKRERMELPDGSNVETLVVHPVIGDRGIFAPRAKARVWLTDDRRRIPVQIRTTYPFGTVMLRLEKMTLVPPTPRAAPGGP